jgi:hypothetical protein
MATAMSRPALITCHYLGLEPEELDGATCRVCDQPLLVLNVAWETARCASGIEQAGYCVTCDAVHLEGPPWPSPHAS